MALWSACWTLDQAVHVRALAGVTVLCTWAGHFTVTVPLDLQPGVTL